MLEHFSVSPSTLVKPDRSAQETARATSTQNRPAASLNTGRLPSSTAAAQRQPISGVQHRHRSQHRTDADLNKEKSSTKNRLAYQNHPQITASAQRGETILEQLNTLFCEINTQTSREPPPNLTANRNVFVTRRNYPEHASIINGSRSSNWINTGSPNKSSSANYG